MTSFMFVPLFIVMVLALICIIGFLDGFYWSGPPDNLLELTDPRKKGQELLNE